MIMKCSKDRPWYINLLFCFICLVGIIVLPTIFSLMYSDFIKSETICSFLSEVTFVLVLVLMYYKDLIKEAKTFKRDFKKSMKSSIKHYVMGIMSMIFFNLLITMILKNDISTNESQVREMLFNNTIYALINISIYAPISEEIIFRKSIQPLINNKWLYAFVCGVLFGGAHILTNVLGGTFVISDLIYILPYGSLGVAFALMDYENRSVFNSMTIHCLHNTMTALLLLSMFYLGVA
jgi:membrane protease YdiL (CAAX protease family)